MLLGENKNEGSDSKSPNANMGGRVSERYPIGEWGCWIIDKVLTSGLQLLLRFRESRFQVQITW